jgi:peptidoglycan/LPS O-acetylase OafA/YrhL
MIHREISDKKFQIDSVDGLRGFAALIVVFSHTSGAGMFFIPSLDLSGIGKSGVFLFFLLSSFLLTRILLDKGKGLLTLPVMSHYWQRRFFRIYPLYTFYLILSVVSTWFIATFLGKHDAGLPLALDLNGFINHIFLRENKGVTWSIAVEFKFYFILPVLATALSFIRLRGFMATLFFIAFLLIVSQIIAPQGDSLINDARVLPYMPIFIIGMLLADIQDRIDHGAASTRCIKKGIRYLGYLGVIGVIVMTPLVSSVFSCVKLPDNYFHKQFIVYAVLWAFILLSSVNSKGLARKFFSSPILRFYGALSFSLYLFHPIFIDLVMHAGINEHASAWVVLLASTIAALLSFRWLEEPALKFKLDQNLMAAVSKIARAFPRTK